MYCPLGIKTDYSLLSSLIKIDKLISYLKKYNITSCAICDDHLYGTMEFYHKMLNNNIKPIIGLEVTIDEHKLYLYAKNYQGYLNLVTIENIKNTNNLTLENILSHSKDVICITDLKNPNLDKLKSNFDLYIISNNKEMEDNIISNNYNPIFFYEIRYLEKYEYKYLPYLFLIRDGKTIKDNIDFTYQNNHLFSEEEVKNLNIITSVNNSLKLSDMCNFAIEHNLYMPKYDVEDSKEYLINLSRKGLSKRLNGNVTKEYEDRLKYELNIILKMHFEDYFLVVYDYIKYAKQNNILVGPGRGSAPSSLVSYSLGITDIDPLKYNLLFERFLNPERVTMPDIDTDFPDVDRDKVIDYVINKYGKKRVAGIITFGTLGAKQAVRDVGRVLNIPIKDIDYICKKLSYKDTLKDLKNRDKEINNILSSDDKYKLLYHLVGLIDKNKRHTSIHAAGIVISYKDLDQILPIVMDNNYYLTEYTMEYLEEIGLIKMDFLGIRNLSIIQNIINDLKKDNINIKFQDIPLEDKEVFKIFENGDTTGIFQFESVGMRNFLRQLKPKSFMDICAAIALFRPGPAINIPSYINRKENKEKIDYYDDSLKKVLEETRGIIVYQEQIMQIANIMAGYTLGEADILRRAMSKKKLEVLLKEEEKFINNSINNGYSKELATKIYNLILNFANYGFNKSHSVSYSIIAYKMAYFKYYYPKYFYSNILEGVVGSEVKTNEYLKEIKKLGIKILPPDVNKSYQKKYRVTNDGIIMPLLSIRNIGDAVANEIVEERKNNPYTSLFDFLKRTNNKTNNKKILESLIYSNSLKEFGYNRNTILENLDTITNYVELSSDLEDNIIPEPIIEIKEELNVDTILEHEKELFGFYLTSHKTEKYKLKYQNSISILDAPKYFNKNVNIIISIDKVKELATKKNDLMAFIDGSDNTGSISVVIFPKLYQEVFTNSIKKGNVLLISGNIEKRFNEYQLIANKITKLED